jgi:hypothetical protein
MSKLPCLEPAVAKWQESSPLLEEFSEVIYPKYSDKVITIDCVSIDAKYR